MATGLYFKVSTPEVNKNYVNASVMLLRGNTYSRRRVIGRKIYAGENSIGSTNYNPILDTHKYRVGFDDGDVSNLT